MSNHSVEGMPDVTAVMLKTAAYATTISSAGPVDGLIRGER
ncbi:hypothetical protein [Arthrobacter sp. SX1312]|nr:hypothetical protein [Arthrobacter sp. SX1312]